jgi:hypothetical protein
LARDWWVQFTEPLAPGTDMALKDDRRIYLPSSGLYQRPSFRLASHRVLTGLMSGVLRAGRPGTRCFRM